MTMNGDGPPQDEALRQARMAVETLASDMARVIMEASQGEGENQVNFIMSQLVRLFVAQADLRAANLMLQEQLQAAKGEPVGPEDVEVVAHPGQPPETVPSN